MFSNFLFHLFFWRNWSETGYFTTARSGIPFNKHSLLFDF
jgi:hypothetical protein